MDTFSRTPEITIISGEGLLIRRSKPVKKNAFVTVQTDFQTVKSTKIDVEGGSYPAWNEKLFVQMPMHARFFTVEVQCKVSNGCKVIGTARIPVSDFTGGYFPENYLHFLSYRLRDGNGERNGIINISVRTKVNGGAAAAADYGHYFPVRTKVNGGCGGGAADYGTPYLPSRISPPVGDKVSNGIVTGVPVWNR